MYRNLGGIGAALLIFAHISPASAATDQDAITAALSASASAWNRGDLAGFMAVYERGPQTAYIKHDGPVLGADAISAMYATRFAGPPAARGTLSLTVLSYRPLGADYALVTGRFSLARLPTLPTASGIFTLVFHRSAAGWGIISDHTS